jgi:hypothetical protein
LLTNIQTAPAINSSLVTDEISFPLSFPASIRGHKPVLSLTIRLENGDFNLLMKKPQRAAPKKLDYPEEETAHFNGQ